MQLPHKFFLVGGYVRDMYLQRKSKDIDLVFLGGFEEMLLECQQLGQVVDIKEQTSTARVKMGNSYVDISLARREKYISSSRVPVCEPASSMEEDVVRRDLTINSMYVPLTEEKVQKGDFSFKAEEIVDLFQGKEHAQQRLLTTPRKDMGITFVEDPLRILRVLRFKVVLGGWSIDPEVINSWSLYEEEIKNNLSCVSSCRVMEEINKILPLLSSWEVLELLQLVPKGIDFFSQVKLKCYAP